ncbi:MAG TPA: hypothetical protein VHG70_12710 [Nocardioidaceae bacterium]|nr:hypothetical protein [Nocardioidaceae bacterium]
MELREAHDVGAATFGELPTSGQRWTALWRLVETYHAVVYFAPERAGHYEALGLKGGWMGYFASRSGALGVVPPEAVTACFYNFKHTLVARALPDAWTYTTPALACQARLAVFDQAIRRLLGELSTGAAVREAAEVAVAAVDGCDLAGRPLSAAHAAQPVPEDPHLALFWAAAVLREFRGDGHNIALAHAGVGGCEAHVLMCALGLVPADQRRFRGWDDDDWSAATARLQDRGWLDDSGHITAAGRRARAEIERVTDRLSETPWRHLGADRSDRLREQLTPLAARIVTGGGVPYPNGMGVPCAPELAATR